MTGDFPTGDFFPPYCYPIYYYPTPLPAPPHASNSSLHEADIERIARRVAELLKEEKP
jgi:hypothetical protein